MNEKIMNILRDKPIVIPRIMFLKYKDLGLNNDEFILLIFLLDIGDKIEYNPEFIATSLKINKFKVMEIINGLFEKKIINIVVEKNKHNKTEEYISMDLLYDKIFNELLNEEEVEKDVPKEIFTIFEQELGRVITPLEYEMIKKWIDEYKYEITIEALKEAVYNGTTNFRYIDSILSNWKKNGIKNKENLTAYKNRYRKSKKEKVDYFEYNWLEDE